MMVGKYPRRFEKLNRFEGCLSFKLYVIKLSSSPKVKPKMVTIRAVVFR